MRTLTILIASLAAAAALVLPAGCGDSGTAETAKGSESADANLPSKVTVTMGEWFFRLNHARVKAGKVTVTARNVGDIEHELIAVKTDLPADEMPMTAEGLDADKAGELVIGEPHEHGGEHGDEHGDEHMDEAGDDDHGDEAGEEHSHEAGDEHGDDDHGDEHGDDHGDEHGSEAAEEGHLKPGETRRYVVDLKPGKYVLLCSIPGHYEMGQYVGLVAVR
jgi:uncharacterized cupredoxin-like copper-binding protein